MTPQEALAFLDQLVSQVNLNRQMTLKAIEAVQVLQVLINAGQKAKTQNLLKLAEES